MTNSTHYCQAVGTEPGLTQLFISQHQTVSLAFHVVIVNLPRIHAGISPNSSPKLIFMHLCFMLTEQDFVLVPHFSVHCISFLVSLRFCVKGCEWRETILGLLALKAEKWQCVRFSLQSVCSEFIYTTHCILSVTQFLQSEKMYNIKYYSFILIFFWRWLLNCQQFSNQLKSHFCMINK